MADQREGFEDLVVRYQQVVCGVAYSVLRDHARSEEVAQEAFIIAWHKLPAMSPPPAMPGWLCGIARNLAANAARRPREIAMETPPASDTPLDALLDREASELARLALARLSDRDRDVVVLYYRGEQSLDQVAAALGISEVAARQRLHRGRERLRTALAAVEATLRATRPGPAFTVACVAAWTARGAAGAHAAALATGKTTSLSAIALPGVAAAMLVGALALVFASRSEPAASTPGTIAPPGAVTAAASSAAAPSAWSPAAPPAHPAPAIRRIDPTVRDSLLHRLELARRTREARIGTGTLPPEADPVAVPTPPVLPGELSPDDIQAAVKLIAPLLVECYTNAPTLGNGKLLVGMQLTGEPEIGTVVDATALDGDAAMIGDAEFSQCITETMKSIELPPLAEGGVVIVNYPFVFAHKDQ